MQNGQPSAEIQEEVALTSLGSGPAATNKRHSTSDKMHFPRASLQPITTLGRLPWPQLPCLATGHRFCPRLSHGCGSEVSGPQNLEMGGRAGHRGDLVQCVPIAIHTPSHSLCHCCVLLTDVFFRLIPLKKK